MDRNIPGALEQALEAMSHQELLALVLKLADERADFRRALLANVSISPQIINQQPRKAQQVKKLKQEITNFFNELQHRSVQEFRIPNVRYGSKADIRRYPVERPLLGVKRTLVKG